MTSNLGFALAKHCDVWLGNFRGNRYALNHKTLKATDDAFWDFSLDEFIMFDLPATIDYILHTTRQSEATLLRSRSASLLLFVGSLGYIGHSQGSLTMFGLLSSQPDFNQKIKPFIALAPVARLTNMKTPTKYLIPLLYQITK